MNDTRDDKRSDAEAYTKEKEAANAASARVSRIIRQQVERNREERGTELSGEDE